MQTNSEIVAELKRVAISGELGSASAERLEEYSAALCNPATWELSGDGQFSQVCEAVRVHLLRAHIRNLLECVKSRKDPNAPVEAGHATSVAMCMAMESLRRGVRARWNERQKRIDG